MRFRPSSKNQFKYKCDQCGWTGYFRKYQFARSSKPKCGACGSISLNPTNAQDRILEYGNVRHEKNIRRRCQQCFTARTSNESDPPPKPKTGQDRVDELYEQAEADWEKQNSL